MEDKTVKQPGTQRIIEMNFLELYPNDGEKLKFSDEDVTVTKQLFLKMFEDLKASRRLEKLRRLNQIQAINEESLLEYLASRSKHELLVISNNVNKLMKRSLGPTVDSEVRTVWVEAGRLFAIKSYHYNTAHAIKPKLQESIDYVERLCADLIPFERA